MDCPVAWFHETDLPDQRRRASSARELDGHPLRNEGSPAAQWAGRRAVALHPAGAISRLGGDPPSRAVPVLTEPKDMDDRTRRVGTDDLGQPLLLAGLDDPMSGLGGHSQDHRGDDASWRV